MANIKERCAEESEYNKFKENYINTKSIKDTNKRIISSIHIIADILNIDAPKVSIGNITAHDCIDGITLDKSRLNNFKDMFINLSHEMYHERMCYCLNKTKDNKNKEKKYKVFDSRESHYTPEHDAEEEGAETFAQELNYMITEIVGD